MAIFPIFSPLFGICRLIWKNVYLKIYSKIWYYIMFKSKFLISLNINHKKISLQKTLEVPLPTREKYPFWPFFGILLISLLWFFWTVWKQYANTFCSNFSFVIKPLNDIITIVQVKHIWGRLGCTKNQKMAFIYNLFKPLRGPLKNF